MKEKPLKSVVLDPSTVACCPPNLDCVPAETITASAQADGLQVDDERLAHFARALAHPVRVHIMRILSQHKSCICADVVNDLGLPQSTVSQHLKVLKDADLVCASADGRTMCYCVNDSGLRALRTLIVTL